MHDYIALYADLVAAAVPIAFVFGMGNLIVSTFLSAALGGGLKIGGRRN